MTQLKHTPGPWRIGDAGHTVFGPPNGNPSPQTIAHNLTRANARLIAACPEMLAALRNCQQAILDIIGAADNGQPYSADELAGFAAESAEQARAAIARATGKD